jgi:hypothetical protein
MTIDQLHYDVRQMPSRAFSARWNADLLDRLERLSEAAGMNKSRLAERYVEEGIRMDEHPGIVFRPGPTGRRAGLARGPDVWEVIMTLQSVEERGEKAIVAAAEALDLGVHQVRVAMRYYGAYPDDIDARIESTVGGAEEAEAAWRREQSALA